MPTPSDFKYIGMATQILATLGVAFFIGYWIDQFFSLRIPVAMILLPLLALLGLLYKIVKDTSNTKKDA